MDKFIKLPPNFDLRSSNAATEWLYWLRAFEDFLVGTGQEGAPDKVKLSLLRNMMGDESARVTLTLPLKPEDAKVYNKVIDAIKIYVSPRVNEVFERYRFNERKQKPSESFENFFTDCRQLLMTCNYRKTEGETIEDSILRDKIVQGISDKSVQEHLLRIDGLTLEKAANFCRTSEMSKLQVKEMNPSIEVDAVKFKKKERVDSNASNKFNCRRCQRTHGPRQCPAYGKTCSKCGKENHFAVSCRVKNVQRVEQKDADSSSDSSLFCFNVGANGKDWTEKIKIENKSIICRLDTGADVSIMPLKVYKQLNCDLKLRPCKQNLETFQGSTVKPIGVVNLHCKYKSNECYEDFMVVDCKTTLLGLPGCVSLELVRRVQEVRLEDTDKAQFVKNNTDVFEGHGEFPKPCSIPTVHHEQICHPSARIPHKLYNPLRSELDRLVSRGAISKVDEIDCKACINRLVLVEKPNGKIRLCLDPMELNKYIVRKPQVLLTVDEIATKLKGKKFFSVFDLAEGFHHVPLTVESSWKCCFSTPFGVYRYLVLPYGLSNSPDVFQDNIQNYFGDIPNVITWFDDLLAMGATEQEHDTTVSAIIQRAREIKAKFNRDKLQYKKTEVKYVGQIFNEHGMHVDKARVESLIKLNVPSNKEQLQQIIGSFNYVRRYVPEMAELMAPLCKLLRKDVEFQWLPLHDKVFNKLKNKISQAPALAPFDPHKEIVLQCDASQNGIGCCLFQKDDNQTLKLVACVSRTMNNCELNYSQTEKELLAIYYGTQKFHKYIYGVKDIDVQTDHKPLLSIMCKPISKVGSPRLRRLRLKLLNYQLRLTYVPGKNIHFADMLSRNSLKITDQDHQMLEMVHYVSLNLPMSNERKNEFRYETSKDKVLSEICNYYHRGWPEVSRVTQECRLYYNMKDEIYVQSGLVFHGNKVIVPKSLQPYVLKLVHDGHPGINKCTQKARQLFYWPKLSHDVQEYVAKCRTCEKYRSANTHQPLLPHKIPKLRFSKVGTDILEFGGKPYLVIVDFLSHWLEIRPLQNKTSKCVIDAFQEVFTRFGYPVEIVSDNNPFKSFECCEYYKSKDICITTSSPHYPRSNGMSEKAVNISKNILKKAHEDGVDYRNYVMAYNNTPLSGLQVSPSQILNSRRVRTCIPVAEILLEPKVEKEIHKLLGLKQSLCKQVHDRHVRKEVEYKEGDSIVYRTGKDDYWKKGTIFKKCKEPRSYWISRDKDSTPFRRTAEHLRKSPTNTKSFKRDNFMLPDDEPKCNNHVNPTVEPLCQTSNIQDTAQTIDVTVRTRSGRLVQKPSRFRE